ncbi:MAG: right-handed parallel beta-helix repeat-containing protein [Candidatus Odinarchaeota archaeon]
MQRKVTFTLLISVLIIFTFILWPVFIPKGPSNLVDRLARNEYKFLENQSLHFSLFVSPDGSDSNSGAEDHPFKTINKAADMAQAGDAVLVKRGTYTEYTVFDNSGTEENPIMFIAEEGVVVEGPETLLYWGGIFEMDSVMHITVSGFHLRNSNWFGIMISECSHIMIDSCFVENTEASGIWAHASDNIIIRNNKIRNACSYAGDPGIGAQECITVAQVDTFQVIYNEVYESSSGFAGGEGIDAKEGCSRGEIAYNLVHDNIRLGIYVDSWDALLTDIKVHGNTVFNNYQGIAVSSENGGTAKNIEIYNNLVFDNVHNGIIIGGWDVNGPRENITITSNTVVNNGDETSTWAGGITIQSHANLTNATIINNIVSGNKYWQIMADYSDKGVITCENNLINGFRGYQSETRGLNYQEGDPGFMDVAENNYALHENSIAIDNGKLLAAPVEDIVGNKRPHGNGMDIGAYEYVEPIRIDGNNEFSFEAAARDWQGDGSSLAPYIIEGLVLYGTANNLIEIRNTDVHFKIRDCHISNGYYGIYLSNATNGHITGNTIINHQFDGIYLRDISRNCVIDHNTVHNNSGVGIRIYQSSDNFISTNNLYNHKWSGININGSTSNVVTGNTAHDANVGIELYSSSSNNITGNILYRNVYWGITINLASDDNVAERNDLKENGNSNTELADDGENNTVAGNYYEDWTGTGPYSIDGTTGNQDSFPLINPYHLVAPVITHPGNETGLLKESVLIQWTDSNDAFDHAIRYSVYYSSDNGNSWNVIANDFITASTAWHISSFAIGTAILLKVQAECFAGFVSISDPAGTFTINPETTATTTVSSTSASSYQSTSALNYHLVTLALSAIFLSRRKRR